jgi:ATP-dependent DNA ligase
VSKRKDWTYRSGRSPDWLKMKNADAPAVKREEEEEEEWGKGDKDDHIQDSLHLPRRYVDP